MGSSDNYNDDTNVIMMMETMVMEHWYCFHPNGDGNNTTENAI